MYEQSPRYLQRSRIPKGLNGRGSVWTGFQGSYMPERCLGAGISPVVAGGAVGSVIPGVGTAIGSLIGAGVGLFSGKAHYSPWNFLYDDYPQHIYELETQVVALQNAINKLTGDPQLPTPPMYSKTGGAQYQSSMQAIVPKYVPGSQSQIAAYDRKLNESGGAYEVTVQKQLALIPQLQSTLQTLQARGVQPAPAPVQSGSATAPGAPSNLPSTQLVAPGTQVQPYYPGQSYQAPPLMPQLQPGPSMVPSNISITSPGAPAMTTAEMFPDGLSGVMPYILGAVGLFAILMTQGGKQSTRTVYRTRPRSKSRKR